MQETWATSGLDLHLDIDLTGTRVRRQLENALRTAIQAGRLPAGARLPSSRALSADLGIARNTVADAYGQLVAEGWLSPEPGSGTRVAERVMPVPLQSAAERASSAGPSDSGWPGGPAGPGAPRYSLVSGSPDLSAFPRSAWLAAARRALAAAPAQTLGYADPRGCYELRHALAGYLARARGVRAAADAIVVCSGFTQALALLTQVLSARGATTMAVEEYGHRHHREVIAANGLRVRSVPVDAHGAVAADLADADAALLTPAHQFPLGVPLAARRRNQAATWARANGATIVEDDYDGEFRYDRQAVGAMQALAPDCVVYAGTASKTLTPGLRLAWLVLPPALVDDVVAAKLLADRHTGVLDQLTLAELISSGGYDRHVRKCRLAYRRRREQLAAALQRHAPGIRMTGVAAGLHTVLALPAGTSEDDVVAKAAARGLALEGLASFDAAGDGPGPHRQPAPPREPALVVGFAAPPPHAFTTAIARLCAALHEPALPDP